VKQKLDKVWIGVVFGLLGPLLIFAGYHLFKYGHMGLDSFTRFMRMEGTFSPRISLCVILNLGLFFLFYWQKMDRAAKGVITATFLYALLVVYLKVII
jgi:hypothetical protein